MPTETTFSTELIGRTEKALNAILDHLLADTGLTEPQWVTLTLAVMSGGTIDRAELVSRVAGALKVTDAAAQARVDELALSQLLEVSRGDEARAIVTDAGRQLHTRIRSVASEITHRMWGDLPADDLAAAGRVLETVLERANAELAR